MNAIMFLPHQFGRQVLGLMEIQHLPNLKVRIYLQQIWLSSQLQYKLLHLSGSTVLKEQSYVTHAHPASARLEGFFKAVFLQRKSLWTLFKSCDALPPCRSQGLVNSFSCLGGPRLRFSSQRLLLIFLATCLSNQLLQTQKAVSLSSHKTGTK